MCVIQRYITTTRGGGGTVCKCNQHRVSYTSNPDHLANTQQAGRVLTRRTVGLSNVIYRYQTKKDLNFYDTSNKIWHLPRRSNRATRRTN